MLKKINLFFTSLYIKVYLLTLDLIANSPDPSDFVILRNIKHKAEL